MASLAIDIINHDSTVVVKPSGPLTVHTSAQLYKATAPLIQRGNRTRIDIDFDDISRIDSSAVAVISVLRELADKKKVTLQIRNLSPAHRQTFQLMPAKQPVESPSSQPLNILEWLGDKTLEFGNQAHQFWNLLTDVVFAALGMLKGKMPPRRAVIEQGIAIGVTALPIVLLLSFLLGLILAFQAAFQLRQFGANIYVANLVGISMMREFGPMMTAIIIAGRSGSAIAAELGTMSVQEEIDALRTMGIDPQRYLVLPRLIAISIMQPSLTLMANLVGIFGGFLIGTLYLDISGPAYLHQTLSSMDMGDLGHALLKSLIFAWIIGLIGSYCGMTIRGGASGVGQATTRAVVASIFLIIVVDSLFAMLTTLLG